MVLGIPPNYTGDNDDDLLEPWLITNDLCESIANTEQTSSLNVMVIPQEMDNPIIAI